MSNIKTRKFCHLLFGICHYFVIYYLVFVIVVDAYALNLDKIRVYLLEGDYSSAVKEGELLLAVDEDAAHSDEFYYLMGISYLKTGNYLRASDIFEIVLNEFKRSDFKEEAQLGLGDACFLNGDLTKAGQNYRKLLENYPDTKFKAQAYERLSQIEFKSGNLDEGRDYLEMLQKDFSQKAAEVFYTIQVGAFGRSENANKLLQELTANGYLAYIEITQIKEKTSYRVRVGKLQSLRDAQELEKGLSQAGYPTKLFP